MKRHVGMSKVKHMFNCYQKFGTAMVQKECWAVVVAQLGERLPTPEDQGSKPTMCNLIKTIYLHLKRRTRRTRGREVTILTTTKNISILFPPKSNLFAAIFRILDSETETPKQF